MIWARFAFQSRSIVPGAAKRISSQRKKRKIKFQWVSKHLPAKTTSCRLILWFNTEIEEVNVFGRQILVDAGNGHF